MTIIIKITSEMDARSRTGIWLATVGALIIFTLIANFKENITKLTELSVRDPSISTSKLSQASTWYFPASTKVNTMGFEWADAERQIPTTVYTGSSDEVPSDIIYQSPSFTYAQNSANSAPDIIYQSTGTTQSYESQPSQGDYIPQYTRIWSSPQEGSSQASYTIPQMTGTTVSTRVRAVPGGAARLSSRTQALYSTYDAPAHSRLDSIQAELDALKDPGQLRRHRPSSPPVAAQHPPHGVAVWSWPTAGTCVCILAPVARRGTSADRSRGRPNRPSGRRHHAGAGASNPSRQHLAL